ncbi:MAG: IclR family transcriptional regulator C-terminal domain-containing protein, partial [Pseudomonadota bacterium]
KRATPPIKEGGEDAASDNRDYVSSLARGLEILRAFSRVRRRMTLSEVAAETGMTRAAARRFLLTLVREGYAQTDGKLFDLTPQVLELGFSVISSVGIWDVARPFIKRLSEDIEESVSAAVLDGPDVVYVVGQQFHRVISVGVTIGSRLPAHCTATGRVLLAQRPAEEWDAMIAGLALKRVTPHTITTRRAIRTELKKVKAQDWSLVEEELEVGLLSIAVPLRRRSGEVVGAINVGIPSLRASPEHMVETILPRLQMCVADITASLTD